MNYFTLLFWFFILVLDLTTQSPYWIIAFDEIMIIIIIATLLLKLHRENG
jgi:hypothetical protein